MGYTHYWYRPKEIRGHTMSDIVNDFMSIIPVLADIGVHLAGGDGAGEPEINVDMIKFNGVADCGHAKNSEISIPWPSKEAGGIAKYGENNKAENWFAGAVIDKRCCNGDCSYETFFFPRVIDKDFKQGHNKRKDLLFDFCKTAYRPYDLAVNVFLVIAKHRLRDNIIVSSDGEMVHWQEAMMYCQIHLGYGLEFELPKEGDE